MEFKKVLIDWYRKNKRDLPWRNTHNPYHIWISEVILQQTRVAQGLEYYLRFIETFPTIRDLAESEIDKVMKVWQGLGYYTRARNLQEGARQILTNYNAEIPKSYNELLKIKGIGPYSAGAIASFAFREVVPAIDGNVYRVLSRVFGIFTSSETTTGKKEFFNLAMELIDEKQPDVFNQAMLDFGALQCIPRNPDCLNCPFTEICYAHRNNLVNHLPAKAKKLKVRDRYFSYLLIRYKNHTFIKRREEGDIWTSLYEFPLIETKSLVELEDLMEDPVWIDLFGKQSLKILYVSKPVKHPLSHQTLYIRFIMLQIMKPTYYLKSNYQQVEIESIDEYSTPRVIDNFMAAEPAEKYFRTRNDNSDKSHRSKNDQ